MKKQKILAFSSSRAGHSGYLEKALDPILNLLGTAPVKIGFIPFASVDPYQQYLDKVSEAFKTLPYNLEMVHGLQSKPALETCDCIMVGGGNTFKLLYDLQKTNFFALIKKRVQEGIPYIGWSAGSNILGRSIGTTNDMPIIQPESFEALSVFPFQVNPHYILALSKDFHGETRDMRLGEFLKLNPHSRIVALPEGSFLQSDGDETIYNGQGPGFLFRMLESKPAKIELEPGKNIRAFL